MSTHKRFSDLDGLIVDDYVQDPPSYLHYLQELTMPKHPDSRKFGETDPVKLSAISNLMSHA